MSGCASVKKRDRGAILTDAVTGRPPIRVIDLGGVGIDVQRGSISSGVVVKCDAQMLVTQGPLDRLRALHAGCLGAGRGEHILVDRDRYLVCRHPMSPEGAGRFSGRGNRGVGEQRGQANFVGVVA